VLESKTNQRKSKIARAAWARIRLFAMDVDGILTDGTVDPPFRRHGGEDVFHPRRHGPRALPQCRHCPGLDLGPRFRGHGTSGPPSSRFPMLCRVGPTSSFALQELAERLGLSAAEVCYMGDDDIDAPALQWAGIGATVSTAMPAAGPQRITSPASRRSRGRAGSVRPHSRGVALTFYRALPTVCFSDARRRCGPPGTRLLRGADERPTAFAINAPVINFRVPTFTREGFRTWLLCGAEGVYMNDKQLNVTDLNLTVFSGDAANKVEKIFLSPSALALIDEGLVSGPGALRLITDDFEATETTGSMITPEKGFHPPERTGSFPRQLNDILRMIAAFPLSCPASWSRPGSPPPPRKNRHPTP